MDDDDAPTTYRIFICAKSQSVDGLRWDADGLDALLGVTPDYNFPGIIYETMLIEWESLTVHRSPLLLGFDRRVLARDIDEKRRADHIRRNHHDS